MDKFVIKYYHHNTWFTFPGTYNSLEEIENAFRSYKYSDCEYRIYKNTKIIKW